MEERPNYYAIIPANVRYSDITPNAKLLYGEITCLCNKEGYCYATNDYFSKLYNVSKISISKWIKELKDNNFIKTEIIYKEGSKEILNRYIRIVKDPIKEKFNTPIKEKFKDNNTSINNTRYNIKENIKEKTNIDLSFIENKEFLDLVNKWLLYRKDIKKPYKSNESIKQFYYKLIKLSNNDIDIATEIINNSIANEYQGIFALKTNKFTNNFTNNFERIY